MHLWNQVLVYINTTISVMYINIVLESLKAQLIAVFKVTIILSMLLNCIICQVYKCVVYILKINTKLCRRSSQISFLKEEEFMVLIK